MSKMKVTKMLLWMVLSLVVACNKDVETISPVPEVAASGQDCGAGGWTRGRHQLLGIQSTEEFLRGKGRISHHEGRQGVLVIDLVEVLYDNLPSVFKGENQGVALFGYGGFAGIKLKGKGIFFAGLNSKSG